MCDLLAKLMAHLMELSEYHSWFLKSALMCQSMLMYASSVTLYVLLMGEIGQWR